MARSPHWASPKPGAGPWADPLGRSATRAAQLLLVLTAVSVAVYGLIQLKLVVIPLMIALILSAALSPVVAALRRRGLRPGLATWTTFLAAVLVLGGIITALVFAVRSEWDELVASAIAGWEELRALLEDGPLQVDQAAIDQAVAALVGFAGSRQFGLGALSGISAAAEVVTGGLLCAVVLFYFLKDGDRIWSFFLRGFEGTRRDRMHRAGQRALEVLGKYVHGTAVVAFVDALAIGVALLLLRVPLALPLAVLVFLGGFVPMVGATLTGIFAALVALVANGPVVALIVVAVVVAVNQLDGDVLQPLVMGRTLRLHGLVILLALAAGVVLAGIAGAVLAVPVTAVAWAVLKVWREPPAQAGTGLAAGDAGEVEGAPDAAPGPAS
ncbi:AI-2E family transporter [Zafaria cholistanensis]|uniref:AI-2E family transporter n=1 Tax=Zafaria cholistanensis TaxID=1682741 RepID=A0A5A7NLC5_9MICC|nr:AI-2E family transporter [Zafaria cholistanensis]GER21754.1 AI-2E family transporter [Zafaria cholistanensis]